MRGLVLAASAALATSAAVPGCLAADEIRIDIDIGEIAFTIDATSYGIDEAKARAVLDLDCTGAPAVCDTAARDACTKGCSGACVAQRCELRVDIALYRLVDLRAAVPELANTSVAIDAEIDALTYKVTANTLDVATEPLAVSIATLALSDVRPLGEIEALPAMGTRSSRPLDLTADGAARLEAAIESYRTPFNLVLASRLAIRRGQPLPTGRLETVLRLKAHARR
ncbi:MAG: hypothetical protein KF773_24555 [Deltaproteobacteria bacterium]|nr:hypothetical protein [Deltaproteobacteria bacterium]MCW5808829.1 hypothetical protein [Deltaproteobacteria bacterium]